MKPRCYKTSADALPWSCRMYRQRVVTIAIIVVLVVLMCVFLPLWSSCSSPLGRSDSVLSQCHRPVLQVPMIIASSDWGDSASDLSSRWTATPGVYASGQVPRPVFIHLRTLACIIVPFHGLRALLCYQVRGIGRTTIGWHVRRDFEGRSHALISA